MPVGVLTSLDLLPLPEMLAAAPAAASACEAPGPEAQPPSWQVTCGAGLDIDSVTGFARSSKAAA